MKDIRKIYKVFYPNINFSFQDMLMNKKAKKIINKKLKSKTKNSKKIFKGLDMWSEEQKKLYQEEQCYYQKILIDIFQMHPLISKQPKDVL